MSRLIAVITAADPAQRNQPFEALCADASVDELVHEADALESFRRQSTNLYQRVRALFFLHSLYRYQLPPRLPVTASGLVPYRGYVHLLERRFEEALDLFLSAQKRAGLSDGLCSALAAAYRELGFQTLADQVRQSVRSVVGNRWMFRVRHPEDHPLRLRPELTNRGPEPELFPLLVERTPVRMDLSHSGASDIFFLGMDYPEGARVINASVDLCVLREGESAKPRPPVEAYVRVLDAPVLRLTSVDLQTTVELTSLSEVFNFAADYLGLLKAAVIASGLVPPGMESAPQPLSAVLSRVVGPGLGLEVVSQVNGIPKGSRLAVSTSLLACLIAALMRATGQTRSLTGGLDEDERRLVAARAILGEWLGGSGGGWQDSGGVWPGLKKILGQHAAPGDPEYGVSRGRLLPRHFVLGEDEVSAQTRQRLQESLVLVHGGMAQEVGPILERVTEDYLLRSAREWQARQEACALFDTVLQQLREGDIRGLCASMHRRSTETNRLLLRWSDNLFTDRLIHQATEVFGDDFWGFWMFGGMSGGGMGFLFAPQRKAEAQSRLQELMLTTKRRLEQALPFAMDPVVYDFRLNEQGTQAELLTGEAALMPAGYYPLTVPDLLSVDRHRQSPARRLELDRFGAACWTNPELSGTVRELFQRLLPGEEEQTETAESLKTLLDRYGFDRVQHEEIREDLRSGRLGLAQNRLPANTFLEDAHPEDLWDARALPAETQQALGDRGREALARGEVAVVTLAGGAGSRWTKGAGVVKALSPFCKLGGKFRTFLEVHLAKSRRTGQAVGTFPAHLVTTSYVTHEPIAEYLAAEDNYGYAGPLFLSPGRSIGLRFIPTVRDLRFAWEETPQQLLDQRAQKVRDNLHQTLLSWAQHMGEGADYTDNLPLQCLHPVGHWYEVPNLLLNGVLQSLLAVRPQVRQLLVHNIDTVAADLDPVLLGRHLEQAAAMTVEINTRRLEDRGGGLARVNGRPQLVEGLALPSEEVEFGLSYYNTNTYWIDLDQLLAVFGLTRETLSDTDRVVTAVRTLASRMKSYITLKEVKKRWGRGQEDVYPVAQFEKLWGDMTALPELNCAYLLVPRVRGQQLKQVAQLDGWVRDGAAAHTESLCAFS